MTRKDQYPSYQLATNKEFWQTVAEGLTINTDYQWRVSRGEFTVDRRGNFPRRDIGCALTAQIADNGYAYSVAVFTFALKGKSHLEVELSVRTCPHYKPISGSYQSDRQFFFPETKIMVNTDKGTVVSTLLDFQFEKVDVAELSQQDRDRFEALYHKEAEVTAILDEWRPDREKPDLAENKDYWKNKTVNYKLKPLFHLEELRFDLELRYVPSEALPAIKDAIAPYLEE